MRVVIEQTIEAIRAEIATATEYFGVGACA